LQIPWLQSELKLHLPPVILLSPIAIIENTVMQVRTTTAINSTFFMAPPPGYYSNDYTEVLQ
jgi:hypothetical protein